MAFWVVLVVVVLVVVVVLEVVVLEVVFCRTLKVVHHLPSSVRTLFEEIKRFFAKAQANSTFCAEVGAALKVAFREIVKPPLSGWSQFKLLALVLAT